MGCEILMGLRTLLPVLSWIDHLLTRGFDSTADRAAGPPASKLRAHSQNPLEWVKNLLLQAF